MEEELAMLRRELASTRAAAALMVRLMEIKAELNTFPKFFYFYD